MKYTKLDSYRAMLSGIAELATGMSKQGPTANPELDVGHHCFQEPTTDDMIRVFQELQHMCGVGLLIACDVKHETIEAFVDLFPGLPDGIQSDLLEVGTEKEEDV